MTKTFLITQSFILPRWFVINAENQILGRLASQISQFLLNKYTKVYNPYAIPKIKLIIINANKIVMTSKKFLHKKYKTFSGYQGGLHFKTFLKIKYSNYDKLLRSAIRGMLPKNSIGRHIFSNLFFSKTKDHKHLAQNPTILFFKE